MGLKWKEIRVGLGINVPSLEKNKSTENKSIKILGIGSLLWRWNLFSLESINIWPNLLLQGNNISNSGLQFY